MGTMQNIVFAGEKKKRAGGGVSFYVRDSIEYAVREDISKFNSQIECLFIEIDKKWVNQNKNVVMGVIYRPPDTDMALFNEQLQTILDEMKSENKSLYLLGDFNIDLLNIDKHKESHEFTDLMYSHSLIPNIVKPTRITDKSATLIDNIFSTNSLGNDCIFNGILYTDISDHFPVFHIDYSCTINSAPRIIKKRVYSEANKNVFSSRLRDMDWSFVTNANNPQDAYTQFVNEFSKTYNICFPIKTFRSSYKNRKPWLSDGLKKSIKKKNSLYRRKNRTKIPEHEEEYKRYRNRLTQLLHDSEREHYEQRLKDNQSNL